MSWRLFAVFRIIAPIFYVLTLTIGGLLSPSYGRICQAMSELVRSGGANSPILDLALKQHNLLAIVFAIGLYRARMLHVGSELAFHSLQPLVS